MYTFVDLNTPHRPDLLTGFPIKNPNAYKNRNFELYSIRFYLFIFWGAVLGI